MKTCLTCCIILVALTKATKAASSSTGAKLTSEYYTAFLNITYYDKIGDVYHTERTETGRYSSSSIKEVYGLAVELTANLTSLEQDGSNGSSAVLDYTGCDGPFVQNWPTDQPWIAVIQRGKCTFNTKIAHAVALKASGVLIYDNASGGGVLQSMKVDPYPIPSVFTYNWKGKEIRSLIQDHSLVFLGLERGSHCEAVSRQVKDGDSESQSTAQVLYCTPEEDWKKFQHLFKKQSPFWNLNLTALQGNYDFNEKRTSVLFVSVSFIVLMLISLAWLIFYYVQRFRYIHAKDKMERKLSGQAKRALAIIPTVSIKREEEENPDTCAVCIENYRIGDIVRILPCNHRFHKNCIDQWLLDRRTCPMCKMDILKHYGLVHDEEAEDREETMLNLA